MKKELCSYDFRIEEDKEKILGLLNKMKPFAKYADANKKIPIEAMEKFANKCFRKYAVSSNYIFMTRPDNTNSFWYTVSILNDESKERVETLYGITLYELFAKLSVYLYSAIKKGEIVKRDE